MPPTRGSLAPFRSLATSLLPTLACRRLQTSPGNWRRSEEDDDHERLLISAAARVLSPALLREASRMPAPLGPKDATATMGGERAGSLAAAPRRIALPLLRSARHHRSPPDLAPSRSRSHPRSMPPSSSRHPLTCLTVAVVPRRRRPPLACQGARSVGPPPPRPPLCPPVGSAD